MRPEVRARAERRPLRRERQHLDDAAERVGAVQIAARPADDLHPLDGSLRHLVPVNPAAEGVVQREAVGEHQRATGAGAREAAQGDALGRRIRNAGRRPSEEAEPGRAPQGIVHRAGAGREQLGGGNHRDAGRRGESVRAARRRDRHGLDERRMQGDPNEGPLLARKNRSRGACEARQGYAQKRLSRRNAGGFEPPVPAGFEPARSTGRFPELDSCSRQGRSRGVGNDAFHSRPARGDRAQPLRARQCEKGEIHRYGESKRETSSHRLSVALSPRASRPR